MKTNTRKSTISFLAFIMLLCISFISTMSFSSTSYAADVDDGFYSIPGASILISEETLEDADTNGIRFGFEMDEDLYKDLVQDMDAEVKVFKSGVSVTAYIVPQDKISATDSATLMADEDTRSKTISADKWKLVTSNTGSGEKVYFSYAYLYDLPDEAYGWNIAACAKLTTENGDKVTDVQIKSMTEVAVDAMNDYYEYGSYGYNACLKYCPTKYTLTLGSEEYTVVPGLKLKALPAVEQFNGLNGKWTLADGTVIDQNTVWNGTANATAVVVYDATERVNEIALCKYTYANDNANYKTMNAMLSSYDLGTVSAVYSENDLATDKLDVNGKLNPTAMVNGTANVVAKVGDAYIKIPIITADGVLTNANQSSFSAIINANLAGDYILDDDINFTTKILPIGYDSNYANSKTFNKFTGTFDGRGHYMKNMELPASVWANYPSHYRTSIFAYLEKATLKNFYAEYNSKTSANWVAFIGQSCLSKIENIYVKIIFSYTSNLTGEANGVIVGRLSSIEGDTTESYFRNCVGEISVKNGVSVSGSYMGTLLGISTVGTERLPINCYGISNGRTLQSYTACTVRNNDGLCAYYSNAKYVITQSQLLSARADLLDKTFNAADGWSKYWKKTIEGNTTKLYFGNTLIAEKTA